MGLLAANKPDPNRRLVAFALAAGVPFTAYLATASASSFWLDSGEFVAQAVHLDIAHPPGHPLAGLLGKLFTLIPLGPLPLRVALAQALCAAIAAGFLYRAIDTTVRAVGVTRDRVVIPLSLGGTWWIACSYGWWFQAVRPEVYALEAALVMVALERVVALEAAWPTLDVRPLYVAALALGLGLANHHFIAFLALPAIAPTLARVYRARGLRPLLIAGGAIVTGLASYVYLPVRAATDPPLDLGDPSTVGNFFWVVSARVYAKNIGTEAVQPMGERFLDLLRILGENLAGFVPASEAGPEAARALIFVALVAVAAYAILRTPGARRIGVVWTLMIVVNLGGRAWLNPVRQNPDVLGYMMPGFAAVGAIVTALLALLLARFGQLRDGSPRAVSVVLAVAMSALGLAQLRASAPASSLASFRATDAFDAERIRRLPPNAVLVAHRPETVFRHWEASASEGARPDVTLVPMPFLDYPGVLEALVAKDPDVTELLRGYTLEGELRQPDLQSLAAERPLLVELDVLVPTELYETLVPAGLFYEVVDAGATDTDVIEAAGPHSATLARLTRHLGEHELGLYETRANLLWIHYMDALYYASVGAREPARQAVRDGLALSPGSPELTALGERLADPIEEGPIDVAPFVVGGAP